MNTSFEESVRARMKSLTASPPPADVAARAIRVARRRRWRRALTLAAALAVVAVWVLLTWRPPALSAVPEVGVDPMGTPVAAAVIDVSAWSTADFADPTGSAQCSMSADGVACQPFTTVALPKNACSGLMVAPVLGTDSSSWSCAAEMVSLPTPDSPTVAWAKGRGYAVVPEPSGGDYTWQTLPVGVTLTRGPLSCHSDKGGITCVLSDRSLILTTSATTFTGPHQDMPTGAVQDPTVSITGVGGLTVGMTAQQARDAGLIAKPVYGCADRQMTDAFYKGYDGVTPDWGLGPTLRGILIEGRTEYVTAEGAHVGTTLARLRELYGNRLVDLPRTKANFDGLGPESGLWVDYGSTVPVLREGNRYLAFPILRDASNRDPGAKTGVVSEIMIGTINTKGQLVIPVVC
jgi:hypothetical protein